MPISASNLQWIRCIGFEKVHIISWQCKSEENSIWEDESQRSVVHISLWLSNIPLYMYTTASLSIPLWMNTQVASISWLLQIMLQ